MSPMPRIGTQVIYEEQRPSGSTPTVRRGRFQDALGAWETARRDQAGVHSHKPAFPIDPHWTAPTTKQLPSFA